MTVTEAVAVALERWTTQRSVLAAALRFPTVFDDEGRTTARVDELIERCLGEPGVDRNAQP